MYDNELISANLVSYGCKVGQSDKRFIGYQQQRQIRGWDDTETWSFYTSISKFILPRLERFKEITRSYPTDLTHEEWLNIIETMLVAFRILAADEDFISDNELMCKIDLGLDNFRKYFQDLWW